MSLITLGINHKTAPLDLRERLAFTPQSLPEALLSLKKLVHIEEASILSTCNRTELYCVTTEDNDQAIIQWFSQFHGLKEEQIKKHIYLHAHEETIRHAMEVASGLDSMVLGEPQIAGQMKDAYAVANEHGAIGQLLGKLYQRVFAVSKQVRTDTDIGSSPVSVAFAAVSLAKQIFGDLKQTTVLLVGAGETIELTARHLHSQGVGNIIIANRSIERAQKLADEFQGEAISLQHISDHLHKSDIVIASTASPLPIIGKGTVERALKQRKHEPIFMVDLAVPRDIEPEVSGLDDVYLYSVDDLQSVIEENMGNRLQAAEQAREIIDIHVSHFLDWQKSLGAVDVIAQIRTNTQNLSDEVLTKAKKQLAAGQNAEDVLDFLANTLTNKFLHQPSTKLREASQENRNDVLSIAQDLFLKNDTADKPDTKKSDE
ncbi:Glutamyl-tRNA reductase [hydrothermal vent metagenome]|uniref:glutamyl-tRNA reductase n=1 Tax=hydrothermal vent metagenome TaxID=652676 RepID=A0A3B0W2P9_9ZZZZ